MVREKGVQLSDCDKVIDMIAAALIREHGCAYGKGMAIGHAGTDTEGTAEDKGFRPEAAESARQR